MPSFVIKNYCEMFWIPQNCKGTITNSVPLLFPSSAASTYLVWTFISPFPHHRLQTPNNSLNMPDENAPPPVEPTEEGHNKEAQVSKSPRSLSGWDGKLRITSRTPNNQRAVLENPEALSDPEYSDEDHVNPGEQIEADEGVFHRTKSCCVLKLENQIFSTIIPPIPTA